MAAKVERTVPVVLGPNEEIARKLILLGAKTFVTMYVTGLSDFQVRRLWGLLRSDRPIRGIVPDLPRMLRNRRLRLEISLFVGIYKKLSTSDIMREADFPAWLKAHDLYQRLRHDCGAMSSLLCINQTFRLVTALRLGDDRVELRECRCCQAPFFDAPEIIAPKCPVCEPASAAPAVPVLTTTGKKPGRRRKDCPDARSKATSTI